MNLIDSARRCEHNAEVQYPTDPHAFNIAYEAFLKGAKYADKGNTFVQINNYSGKQEKEHGI